MIFNSVVYGGSDADLLYIYIAKLPNKIAYYTGENFDPTGMIIKGVNKNLTERVIPNSALTYEPEMPLTEDSGLLKMKYIENGRLYGTSIALVILFGAVLYDDVPLITLSDVDPIDIHDNVETEFQTPIRIDVSDYVSPVTLVPDISVVPIDGYIGAGPFDPNPIAPVIVRVIFELNTEGNPYITTNENNQIILQTIYNYTSTPLNIVNGNACAVTFVNDDKAEIESAVIESGEL